MFNSTEATTYHITAYDSCYDIRFLAPLENQFSKLFLLASAAQNYVFLGVENFVLLNVVYTRTVLFGKGYG